MKLEELRGYTVVSVLYMICGFRHHSKEKKTIKTVIVIVKLIGKVSTFRKVFFYSFNSGVM